MENKENKERAQLWQQPVAQLKASGMSQRAYAMEHGFSEHQVSYWVRGLTIPPAACALLPVLVAPSQGADLHGLDARRGAGRAGRRPGMPPAQPSLLRPLLRNGTAIFHISWIWPLRVRSRVCL